MTHHDREPTLADGSAGQVTCTVSRPGTPTHLRACRGSSMILGTNRFASAQARALSGFTPELAEDIKRYFAADVQRMVEERLAGRKRWQNYSWRPCPSHQGSKYSRSCRRLRTSASRCRPGKQPLGQTRGWSIHSMQVTSLKGEKTSVHQQIIALQQLACRSCVGQALLGSQVRRMCMPVVRRRIEAGRACSLQCAHNPPTRHSSPEP